MKMVLANVHSPRTPLSKTTMVESSRASSSSTSASMESKSTWRQKEVSKKIVAEWKINVATTGDWTLSKKSHAHPTSDKAPLKGFLKTSQDELSGIGRCGTPEPCEVLDRSNHNVVGSGIAGGLRDVPHHKTED
ncbi:Uncharacterized protein Fot_14514 [Forsythia ovata]|uniref:Uncharacterized protein n=1 Tax=Forsythia ovata TaxID=205694 RepID=A0ABD1W6I9_9LAMI